MSDVLEREEISIEDDEVVKIGKITRFDAAKYLETQEDFAFFMEDAFETGDVAYIAHALGVVARARSMSEIAKKTGLGRESLYKALSSEGNPSFGTILKVCHALGLELRPHLMSDTGQ